MNIEQKLQLSKRPNTLTLINEGVFLRAYNESAYILTELLEFNLKINHTQVKKLDNQFVVFCGFPKRKVNTYLPNLIKTNFGFELIDVFPLYFYRDWFIQKQAAERCNNKREHVSAGA